MEAPSPVTGDTLRLELLLNGQEDTRTAVTSVQVSQRYGSASSAIIGLQSMPGEPMFWTSGPVRIAAAYGNDPAELLFEGTIDFYRTHVSGSLFTHEIHCTAPQSLERDGDSTTPALRVEYGQSLLSFEGRSSDNGVTNTIHCRGNAAPLPGTFVELAGTGSPFDGIQRVISLFHVISDGNWKTTVVSSTELPPAPAPPATQQSVLTQGGLGFSASDEQGNVSLVTPSGSRIVISEREHSVVIGDAHGNRVELSAGGIRLASTGDIALSAAGRIRLESDAGIEAISKQDIQSRALNISNQAQLSFVATAQTEARVDCSGTTRVRGALVMIN